ncbi:MAG TPA: hypothetical protein DCM05_04690 [Elusimicrobia bacterium]|nr:hypothetical protein [Elusimicrobiota bacterium]
MVSLRRAQRWWIFRAIRKNRSTKTLPILMLSAINEKGVCAGTFSNRDRDDSLLPVDQFIEKPIRPDQLLEKIQDALKASETKAPAKKRR